MPRGKKAKQKLQQHNYLSVKNDVLAGSNTTDAKISWSTSDEVEEEQSLRGSICSFDEHDWAIEHSKIISFITKQLIFSRVFLLVFQFFINRIMKDYPTDAFKGLQQIELSRRDSFVQNLLGGLGCWDARHFLHVAEFGYTWESTLAFFPLFPTILRVLGTTVQLLFGPMNLFSAMLLSGVLFNNIIFVINGLLLFRLAHMLTGSLKEAIISVYVFCWSPASIFFSSVYSESLYTLFTFSALVFLHHELNSRSRQILTAFILSFAFLTRANGITNIGYIAFQIMLEVILRKSEVDGKLEFEDVNVNFLLKALSKVPILLLCFCIMVLPLRLFGFAMEEKFCTTEAAFQDQRVLDFLQNNSAFVLPGDLMNMSWCSADRDPSVLMPPYYPEVQEKYWGVSLFGYWQLKKIPFFLMAAPSLGFVFYGIVDLVSNMINDSRRIEQVLVDRRTLIPFAVQSLFVAFAGLLFYNVETPLVKTPDDLVEPFLLPFLSIYARVRLLHFLMLSYLLGFFFIGTTLHVNWLPFL